MKTFLRITCVIICISLFLPVLSSCGNDNVYELGPYSINEEEYAYLLCTYKRRIMENLGLDENYLDYPISSSSQTTYNEYIETMYRQEFEQSVYTLLYSLALFDEYELEFSKEEENSIKRMAKSVISAYGDGKASTFNSRVKDYGFSDDTLYDIYEKQAKESAVISYLYGDNYSKITESQKEQYFQNNYIHFQVLVVNTLYYQNSSGAFVNYSKEEQESRKALRDEINDLICRKDTTKDYKTLSAFLGKEAVITNANGEKVINVTFEELWANSEINDDSLYPNGYYMAKATNIYQLMNETTLSVAMKTDIGSVAPVTAKRYFEGDGTIDTGDGNTTVKEGDYFEYGTAFIKRLSIDEYAWKSPENKDFFTDTFITGAAQYMISKTLQQYEDTSPYTLLVKEELKNSFSLSTALPNYVDYDYFHPSDEE